MRKVIASVFVSLDGIMQAPGGPDEDPADGFAFGGWVFPLWDETLGEAMSALFEAPFDLLLGRRTYDIFSAYWPHQDDPIAERFNAVTKFVATSSDEPLAWHGSVALRGDVTGEIRRLKQQDGPNLLVQGSSVLLHSLFAESLVDELTVLTFPVVLGTGKKLFDEGSAPGSLKLVDSRTSSKGVIIARYVPAGEVRTGSFADPEAGEARRERGKKEEPA